MDVTMFETAAQLEREGKWNQAEKAWTKAKWHAQEQGDLISYEWAKNRADFCSDTGHLWHGGK